MKNSEMTTCEEKNNEDVLDLESHNTCELTSTKPVCFHSDQSKGSVDILEIRRIVSSSGQKRAYFLVAGGGESTLHLRSRGDVVRFLEKRKDVNLVVEDFCFKQRNSGIQYYSTAGNSNQTSVEEVNYAFDESEPNIRESDHGNIDSDVTAFTDEFEAKMGRIMGQRTVEDQPDRFHQAICVLQSFRSENSSNKSSLSESSVEHLKSILTDVNVKSDTIALSKEILRNEDLYNAIKQTIHNQVETEIDLLSLKESKSRTMTFPIDVKSNIYCDIIEEAAVKMPLLLEFLVNITNSVTAKLTQNSVIRTASLISDLFSCKDKRHSALQKINSLHLMFQKSTLCNLKSFGLKGLCSGYSEASRLVEEMSELSDYFKSSKYSLDLGMQLTADNVDCVMKGNLEHWILAYSRMDPIASVGLSDDASDFNVQTASHDIVYLEDQEVEYLSECCRVILAKKLHSMNIGLSKILKQKPYKPVHKYHEMADKQEIFYEALEPLHEMEHQGRSKIIVL